MGYENIQKIIETENCDDVNCYLKTTRWVILAVSPGRTADGSAYHLYSLGWYGPYDPDNPNEPDSEFPLPDPVRGCH